MSDDNSMDSPQGLQTNAGMTDMQLNISVPKSFTHGPHQTTPFHTITAAFFHHAASNPDLVAARDLSAGSDVHEITYHELAHRATILAHHLVAAGVNPGDRVPLVVKRGISMLAGVLGVLAAGAQYVPLDGGVVPDATLRRVISDAGGPLCKVVLCMGATKCRLEGLLPGFGFRLINVDDVRWEEGQCDYGSIDLARTNMGCYLIYTSGTTGLPKGVDVLHRNVVNLICLAPGNLGIAPGTRVGQMLNISFDMAAWEILGTLCNGGTLVLRGSNWDDALKQIDVLICTPSILSQYEPCDFPSLKTVATAGEPSSQRLADKWATHGTYYNCCGPTETTIVNTMHQHVTGRPLSIGTPTPNNIVYILDVEDQSPVSIGFPGVMWASGAGVSNGYTGLSSETSKRYRLDPFSDNGDLMYNTGDICRWEEDGLITILGRVDDQVKIKGFRVELDGVSASMNSAPEVNRGTVLFIDGTLHGFVSPKSTNIEALRHHLQSRQPYYAIPKTFHTLDELPLTANGKIDKKALRSLLSVDKESTPTSSASSIENVSYDVVATSTTSISTAQSGEKLDLGREIPDKELSQPFRGLLYRIFIIYRRLFTLVGIANIIALAILLSLCPRRDVVGIVTSANLLTAVLVRQDFVINLLYWTMCSVPKSFPLSIRRQCASIYHLGGVHSGAATCAAAWLFVGNVCDAMAMTHPAALPGWTGQFGGSTASRVLSWILSFLFGIMILSAWPDWRKRYHNTFECTHRFVGWTMVVIFWAQTVLAIDDGRVENESLGHACVSSPSFWMLAIATVSIATSWVSLRRVPVNAVVLSNHAVQLYFDYPSPVNGSFVRISQRPLLEWHSFATISTPSGDGGLRGHSVIVSKAGDWTHRCIQKPPTKIWVRGIPTCGVMRIATLFRRVVLIATGSGIGPQLGHIQTLPCPTQLIWSTPDPEKTFGRDMINSIRAKIPDAVIHDTRALGRPDLVKMGYNLALTFQAEAVLIIANEKITKKVVYGIETRGIPAYGAIWDS